MKTEVAPHKNTEIAFPWALVVGGILPCDCAKEILHHRGKWRKVHIYLHMGSVWRGQSLRYQRCLFMMFEKQEVSGETFLCENCALLNTESESECMWAHMHVCEREREEEREWSLISPPLVASFPSFTEALSVFQRLHRRRCHCCASRGGWVGGWGGSPLSLYLSFSLSKQNPLA